jgi:hypothetical protein
MATTKPTRSPRRAQLHLTWARAHEAALKHPAGLPLYEALYALNRDFEQVLADLARLDELDAFQEWEFGKRLGVIVQEMRARANLDVVQLLQLREPEDRLEFGELLIEAGYLLENRWKAAGKKRRQKQPGAGS